MANMDSTKPQLRWHSSVLLGTTRYARYVHLDAEVGELGHNTGLLVARRSSVRLASRRQCSRRHPGAGVYEVGEKSARPLTTDVVGQRVTSTNTQRTTFAGSAR